MNIEESYVSAVVDAANESASYHKCEGYAFQFGYLTSDLEHLIVDLQLNKKQVKTLEKRIARYKKTVA